MQPNQFAGSMVPGELGWPKVSISLPRGMMCSGGVARGFGSQEAVLRATAHLGNSLIL